MNNPYIFPPHNRAFWTPVVDGLTAGLLAFLLGLTWTDDAGVGLGWGVIAGGLVWAVARVAWLRLIWRYYAERPVEVEPPEEPVEEGDPPKLSTRNEDGTRILVLDPPCRDMQLARWCKGMVGESPTTFAFWVTQEREFSQAEYSEFREWLFRRGYAEPVNGNALRLTAEGMNLAKWVHDQGLREYSPTKNFVW